MYVTFVKISKNAWHAKSVDDFFFINIEMPT